MDLGAPNARAKVVKKNKKTNPHSLQIASADGRKSNTIGKLFVSLMLKGLSDAPAVHLYNLPIISSASMQESNDTAHNFLPRSLTDAPT